MQVLTLGCSYDIVIVFCISVIGNFECGLELKNNLKFGWIVPFFIVSIILSNCGIHDNNR